MDTQRPLNVLFLCTHNSARSILAEAALNHLGQVKGQQRFKGYSAGSSPRDNQQPNPLALRALGDAGISTEGLRSKSWDEFAQPDAPHMDLVITVCDNAAGEVCPFWPGHPATAHWGYADPSSAPGSEEDQLAAFKHTLLAIHRRLELLINLPLARLDRLLLEQQARELAKH
jgi:arsenate reductase (thioredoxin)